MNKRFGIGILALVGNMTRGILPFPFLPEHPLIGFRDDGLESLRSKLRNMTEAKLVQFGKTLRDRWDRSLSADQKKSLIELKKLGRNGDDGILSAEQIPKEFDDCGNVVRVGLKAIGLSRAARASPLVSARQ